VLVVVWMLFLTRAEEISFVAVVCVCVVLAGLGDCGMLWSSNSPAALSVALQSSLVVGENGVGLLLIKSLLLLSPLCFTRMFRFSRPFPYLAEPELADDAEPTRKPPPPPPQGLKLLS